MVCSPGASWRTTSPTLPRSTMPRECCWIVVAASNWSITEIWAAVRSRECADGTSQLPCRAPPEPPLPTVTACVISCVFCGENFMVGGIASGLRSRKSDAKTATRVRKAKIAMLLLRSRSLRLHASITRGGLEPYTYLTTECTREGSTCPNTK